MMHLHHSQGVNLMIYLLHQFRRWHPADASPAYPSSGAPPALVQIISNGNWISLTPRVAVICHDAAFERERR